MDLTKTARDLRKRQTKAEGVFWELVRNRKFCNRKFYRQYPISYENNGFKRFFVADFYCPAKKLIVEIDGGIHEQQKEYDKMREEILEIMNFRIIRFSNKEVMENSEQFQEKLKQALTFKTN